MEKRNLDGIYFRVKRNGKYDNVCFSDMTKDEMKEILSNKSETWLVNMCILLGQTIREIGDKFDLCCEYE